MTRPRPLLAALLAVPAVLAALAALLAVASAPAHAQERQPVRRILVVSVPGITWADVEEHHLPVLEAFLEDAAMANMAPRGVSPRSTPGDAYLTISAGARATTERSVDGQVLALEEQSSGSAAGEIFTRRTGVDPDGEFVSLVWPELVRRNSRQPYDAVLGLLAETLAEAGVGVAAIGNADGRDSIGPSYERQVGLAIADTDGVVAAGALEESLLEPAPSHPFGRRLSQSMVLDAVREHWPADDSRSVVVVEASDLARTLRYRPMVDSARYDEIWSDALQESDELLGRLLELVDPERDMVLVVAPYNQRGDRDLTITALRGPGVAPGLLRSASTQRAGFLTLVDVAPTILARMDIERPVEMEGRPAEVSASSRSVESRVETLVAQNAASRFRENLLVPTTTFAVIGLALLCAATVVLLVRGAIDRWRRPLAYLAMALVCVLPASYLARGFPLEDLGTGFYWAFILVVGAVAAAVATLAGRLTRQPVVTLAVVLSFVALVLCLDVMTGSKLSLSAAFGYSPTGNSRLYGISNYSYGQLSAAACLLAAFAAAAVRDRRGRTAALGILVFTLVVLGVPKWGSDVGGVLAFTPAIGVFATVLYRWRVRLRFVVMAVLATAAAITAFGLLDLARPAEERAHLGRLFERVGEEGPGPLFSIMQRKLLANLNVSTSSLWVIAIPVALAFWLFLTRGPGRHAARLSRHIPTIGAGLAAAAVAAVLGSAVNDSGAIVGGVAAMVLAASLVYLTVIPPSAMPPETAPPAPPDPTP